MHQNIHSNIHIFTCKSCQGRGRLAKSRLFGKCLIQYIKCNIHFSLPLQSTEEFLEAYDTLGLKSRRSVYAQLTYDSIWTVAYTLRKAMSRLDKVAMPGSHQLLPEHAYSLADFSYAYPQMAQEFSKIMGDLEFMGVSVRNHFIINNK